MGDYKNLEVWKKSRALTADIYRVTERFPRSEMFGITSQMRRAAMSIVLNVAEGNGRWTDRDQRSFIVTARGSACEVEAVVYLAEDLDLITSETSEDLRKKTNEIGRMLNGLLRFYRKT
ncbi:MAG TPA: four helix bundle protein [Thermoanaerobaculia bacterium]|jgi:four helix bundle protein|nr:four helix bundle protein [Thermoanaerobaculia bacterium]